MDFVAGVLSSLIEWNWGGLWRTFFDTIRSIEGNGNSWSWHSGEVHYTPFFFYFLVTLRFFLVSFPSFLFFREVFLLGSMGFFFLVCTYIMAVLACLVLHFVPIISIIHDYTYYYIIFMSTEQIKHSITLTNIFFSFGEFLFLFLFLFFSLLESRFGFLFRELNKPVT